MSKVKVIVLLVLLCLMVGIGGYLIGAVKNERKHESYKGEKALWDKEVELDVASMSPMEHGDYIKRMLKPLEADNDSRVMRQDCPIQIRYIDTCYPEAVSTGRQEESYLPLTQEEVWAAEELLNDY